MNYRRYKLYWEVNSPNPMAYGSFHGYHRKRMISLASRLIRQNTFAPITPMGYWWIVDLDIMREVARGTEP
jgi:hypothetical protein